MKTLRIPFPFVLQMFEQNSVRKYGGQTEYKYLLDVKICIARCGTDLEYQLGYRGLPTRPLSESHL